MLRTIVLLAALVAPSTAFAWGEAAFFDDGGFRSETVYLGDRVFREPDRVVVVPGREFAVPRFRTRIEYETFGRPRFRDDRFFIQQQQQFGGYGFGGGQFGYGGARQFGGFGGGEFGPGQRNLYGDNRNVSVNIGGGRGLLGGCARGGLLGGLFGR